jgi:hypothetical protein
MSQSIVRIMTPVLMITVTMLRVVITLMWTAMITMSALKMSVILHQDAHIVTLTVMTMMNAQQTAVAHKLDVNIIQSPAMMRMHALKIHAIPHQVVTIN